MKYGEFCSWFAEEDPVHSWWRGRQRNDYCPSATALGRFNHNDATGTMRSLYVRLKSSAKQVESELFSKETTTVAFC